MASPFLVAQLITGNALGMNHRQEGQAIASLFWENFISVPSHLVHLLMICRVKPVLRSLARAPAQGRAQNMLTTPLRFQSVGHSLTFLVHFTPVLPLYCTEQEKKELKGYEV